MKLNDITEKICVPAGVWNGVKIFVSQNPNVQSDILQESLLDKGAKGANSSGSALHDGFFEREKFNLYMRSRILSYTNFVITSTAYNTMKKWTKFDP